VTDHLPERERPLVKQRLRRAWALDDHARALEQLRALASELERGSPGAAGSLREGMEETLTLTRLGVGGNLKRTLESTNPCESMLEIVRRTQRNVKRWSSGEMALRWTAAGMLEAEKQFRKSSATATSPPSSSRSNASTTIAVTPIPLAPQSRRPLSSSPPDHHTGTAAEIPRRAGHPPRAIGIQVVGIHVAPEKRGHWIPWLVWVVGLAGRHAASARWLEMRTARPRKGTGRALEVGSSVGASCLALGSPSR
jgi:Transposase, Mutator family